LKGPIRSLEVTYLLHATEDPDRVEGSVAEMLSVKAPGQVEDLEGHYGNRIRRVRVHLTGDEAQRAFDSIVSRLGRSEKTELLANLGRYLDEHSALFLRFDKQRLVRGTLSLETADPVRIKVKPRPFRLGHDAAKFYSTILEK
jgi:RNA binding exosome subunit